MESRVNQLLRAAESHADPHVSHVVRDNRIVINAVLDTVRELNRIGIQVAGRVEERDNAVDVIVTIPTTFKPKSVENP